MSTGLNLFRQYQPQDYRQICELMEIFQAHLAKLDTLRHMIVDKDYGKRYTDLTLEYCHKDHGKFIVVTEKSRPEKVIGFGVGIIPKRNKPSEVIGHIKKKEGIITELFVLKKFRGRGLGKELIKRLEKHFKQQGCSHSRIAVLADNKASHLIYQKAGYRDRTIELIKKI